jgi:FlaA1/EpsC-like NDP-sugar epimerase/CheY-like chemotaxis protein
MSVPDMPSFEARQPTPESPPWGARFRAALFPVRLFREPAPFEGPRAWLTTFRAPGLAADLLAVVTANVAAFYVRFDWPIPDPFASILLAGLPVIATGYLVSFLLLGTHRGIWHYVGIEDLRRIIKAVALGGSLHAVAVVLLGWRPYPRSVVVSTALLTLLLMGGMRLIARSGFRGRRPVSPASERHGVVIIGAGETGAAIARELRQNERLGYHVLGFVDDDPRKLGATIHGVAVLGPIQALPALARAHTAKEAIVAIPSASGRLMRRIAETCAEAGVKIKTLPSIGQLVRGEGKLRYLRPVNVDELLRRAPVSLDRERVGAFFRGKRVMVTGAGGSIGSELCRQLMGLDLASLIMVERAETPLHNISLEIRDRNPSMTVTVALADVRHIPRMTEIFERTRPQIVFHAAAYKHVPILEDHPGEAVLNNVVGTRRLADLSRRLGVEDFVLVSTDKAAEPKNLLGATKRISEMYVLALNEAMRREKREGRSRFIVVRFGNVLGSDGSVVPLFEKQIETGRAITITDRDASRFFMTIPESVGLIVESVTMSDEGGVFVLDMGEPQRVVDLADDLVTSLGLSPSEVGRRYVGLRAGEKMHERLWDENDEIHRSTHERIFAIRQAPPDLSAMVSLVGELEQLAVVGRIEELLRLVQKGVPSYRPRGIEEAFAVADGGERFRILVVDDDERICEFLKEGLEGTYAVTTARTAGEGFERVKSQRPHVILLDVRLPDRSGLEVCQSMRADPAYRDIRILMMTGHAGEGSAADGLRGGADDYVGKPFDLDELEARIEAVLRRGAPLRGVTVPVGAPVGTSGT